MQTEVLSASEDELVFAAFGFGIDFKSEKPLRG